MKTLRSLLLFVGALAVSSLAFADTPTIAAAAPKPGYDIVLEVEYNEQGIPVAATVIESTDPTSFAVLTNIAYSLVRGAAMEPKIKDGKAVPFRARIPFHFPVEGDRPEANRDITLPVWDRSEGVAPLYPPDLHEQGEVGGAVLELTINTAGEVAAVRTIRASHPQFEEVATNAVKTWKFTPSKRNGLPVESRWNIAISFASEEQMPNYKWIIAPRPYLMNSVVWRLKEAPGAANAEAPAAAPAK
ncbi:MAG: energy transducer TonB [Opitutus sp.]|nr:energy transducer TonB [Opitutus sp.]